MHRPYIFTSISYFVKKRRAAELFKIKSGKKKTRQIQGAVSITMIHRFMTSHQVTKLLPCFGVKQKDGRPMLFGFFIIFTPRLTEFCFLNSEDVEKIYGHSPCFSSKCNDQTKETWYYFAPPPGWLSWECAGLLSGGHGFEPRPNQHSGSLNN